MIVTYKKDDGRTVKVDVAEKGCPSRMCFRPYWCQGTWTRGCGYIDTRGAGMVCGTRHLHGCPYTREDDE